MNSADRRFDLIVVGLGAVGSAALYHAARRGINVLGIDRHHPPHSHGSSHAESRITRLAVGEGEQYLGFVARAHDIWHELAAETGEQLLFQPGNYIVTPPVPTDDERWGGFVPRTAAVAEAAGIDFEIRTPDQVAAHVPNVILGGDESIGFEPSGGIVLCERAIDIQLTLAAASGAATMFDTVVERIEPDGNGVRVRAADCDYAADQVIVATGAWFPELAPVADAEAVAVTRQTVYWFEVDDPRVFSVDRFPSFLWPGHDISEYSGVFPMPVDGVPGLKILGEQFHETTTAETVDRTVSDGEIADFYERLVEPRLRGVRRSVVQTAVCLYTSTIDEHFLVDHHPASERVLFASPCSGHGFKHSTALAEAMVELSMTGVSNLDLSPFRRKVVRVSE